MLRLNWGYTTYNGKSGWNLNTSHVTVKLFPQNCLYSHLYYLNTSHVTVKSNIEFIKALLFKFKYISCYG